MSLNEYLDLFRKAMEKFEQYGYADQLIFRYDNAVHRPALGFKEHRHSNDGKICEAELPDIFDLVDEILRHL